ncbi:macrophage mannose receptor 1-like [Anabas testudineus]|uniref:macrophage mannose receptor 1-like n=1 Tax=Anabas testudineus TaxID=64144 RepID=UPI000E457DEB|nr:macrophage mannose receptor 1-like [Anabas testudineus]XP_026208860.1 macrophage mannose receptor 1-like [Anabas testudineus]XP_026208861.1 macrophage mannose receptor 1-like [Anabas testudineus]XP_026208862.1 macrophage mannose receptor 1-like [Anabas testudineus]
MQWSLFLFILMGQSSFFTCHMYVYHFIGEKKTWDEAQKYCRENYTDLATVSNMTDMERLRKSTETLTEAWIGLHSYPGKNNRRWYWSLPGLEFSETQTRWDSEEPNDYRGQENCVLMNDQKWSDYPCNDKHQFICYSETKQFNKSFHVISSMMTWPQAQRYCREHHTDLVSGLDQLDDDCLISDSVKLWIGVFRDTWRWSDGKNFSFRNWENVEDLVDGQSDKKCATTVLNTAGKWSSADCNEEKPFFCYDDKLILINESKTWVEALNYCREKHYDLVSITNPHQQRWVQERVKKASTEFVWLGLRYTCTLDLWFWVSDEVVSYTNWASGVESDDCDMSAVMERGGRNQWFKKPDNETFNFICSEI